MSDSHKCPRCEGEMRIRINKQTGIEFLGCSSYPECNGTRQLGCPKCGEPMVKRTNKTNQEDFLGCRKFPECRGTRKINKLGEDADSPKSRASNNGKTSVPEMDADDIADFLSRAEDEPF